MTMTEAPVRVQEEVRRDEADRYGIYTRERGYAGTGRRIALAETSLSGIGLCLKTLREDGEITDNDPIGILDRVEHKWIVNPWAVGRWAQ